MSELTLTRLTDSPSLPTFGVLSVDGIPTFTTLELPDKGNQPVISCIPKGNYRCPVVHNRVTHSGTLIPVTLEVPVPDRSGILFHVGNTAMDTRGCILLGMEFYKEGIQLSKLAFDNFERIILTQDFWDLEIK